MARHAPPETVLCASFSIHNQLVWRHLACARLVSSTVFYILQTAFPRKVSGPEKECAKKLVMKFSGVCENVRGAGWGAAWVFAFDHATMKEEDHRFENLTNEGAGRQGRHWCEPGLSKSAGAGLVRVHVLPMLHPKRKGEPGNC